MTTDTTDRVHIVSHLAVTFYDNKNRVRTAAIIPVDRDLFAVLDGLRSAGRTFKVNHAVMEDGSISYVKCFFDRKDVRRFVRIGLGAYGHADGEWMERS